MAFDLNKGGEEKKKFDLSKSPDKSASTSNLAGGSNSGKEKKKSLLWVFILIGILIVGGGIWYFNSLSKTGTDEMLVAEDLITSESQSAQAGQAANEIADLDNQSTQNATNKSAELPYEKNVLYLVYQFPFGSADYSQPNLELDKLVEVMKQNPNVKISIDAYTDNVGSPEFNQILSEKRAKAINDFIISKGIDSSRISHHGKGISTKYDSSSENRRVEFTISD
ncbi:MAG: OmpA family protein [Bacteroidales bacterium]